MGILNITDNSFYKGFLHESEVEIVSRAFNMLNEGADKIYPLFVLFNESPERIRRGLSGAQLPFVIQTTIATPDSLNVLDSEPQYLEDLLIDTEGPSGDASGRELC